MTTLASNSNLSNTTPGAASGFINAEFQDDGGTPTVNISVQVPILVGDTGSGGDAGVAPAPPSGSAAAGKYLKADGTWAVPPGTAGGTFLEEVVTFSGTSGTLSHAPVVLYGIYRNGVRMTALAGSPAAQTFSITGAAVTLSTAAGGSDVFIAVYLY